MVAALLLIDFIILLTWQLVDPLTSKTEHMTLKVNTHNTAWIKLIVSLIFQVKFTVNNFIPVTEKRFLNVD